MQRTEKCMSKLERMNKTLKHEEPDRVPISDFFWNGFLEQWRESKDFPEDADINRYYDLDYLVTMPNTDPHIKSFEIIKNTHQEIVIRTGFEAVIKRKKDNQMPLWLGFDTDSIDKVKAFLFEDPWDERRFFKSGDHQIEGVEENFSQDIPAWTDSLNSLWQDFPLYGSVCEGYETLWRIIGSENALLWMAMYPDEMGRFITRINEFSVALVKAQIKAADGKLDGMMIWGDVAYNGGMLFSPEYWRKYFKPGVKSIIDVCHENGIPVIYHGCGDVSAVFEDFIEIGTDAYNPLQANSGLDVVELRRKYGHRIAFSGNMDVIQWGKAGYDELRKIVLTKLNAAKGGGYIFQSDNSVPDTVSVDSYEYVIDLVREYGKYPLKLGEYNIDDIE